MLDIGSFRASTCSGPGRRSFLKAAAALPFASLLTGTQGAAIAAEAARARSVLFVWLWGAPSHLDTFDPKPDAPPEYRGPFSTIATKQPGVRYTELLPRLAARSDLFTLIRSHVSSEGGHPEAGTVGLTGFKERPDPVQPNFGAIVGKHRGNRGSLPPFVAVGRGIPKDVVRKVEGYGGGTLGKTYDPFLISCSDEGQVDIPALKLLDGLNPNRIVDRRSLLGTLDTARRTLDALPIDSWEQTYARGYGLLTNAEARNAFDLTRESEQVRQQYGFTTFGQSCLLSRRLIEAGVPYVQLNWSEYVEAMTPQCDFGWDTHIMNFELLQDRHGPIFDRAFAALLDDLRQRGLLETTLVVAMGEFGRTPRINGRAARDHWPQCYFSLWAGAGLQGGRVIGQSDKYGENPITTPFSPLMVGTTIAHLAGMDTQARAEMNVLNNGAVIQELL